METLAQTTRHILKVHHNYLWREMGTIENLVRRVASEYGPRDPSLITMQRLFSSLVEDLTWHLRKEEDIIFPRILALEKGENMALEGEKIEQALPSMLFEHRGAEEALAELRLLTRDYKVPEYADLSYKAMLRQLQNFESDMVEHIRIEDDVLFPRCLELEAKLKAL